MEPDGTVRLAVAAANHGQSLETTMGQIVADSQRPMLDSNRESLKNLRENLLEIGLRLDEVPRVFQFNKRDLSNVLSPDEMNSDSHGIDPPA